MKKAIWIIIIFVIVALIAFSYVTRPVAAPTDDINAALGKLPAGSATSSTYLISQTSSKAEFRIGEVLRGSPYTVVGTTTQVAGRISVDGGGIEFSDLRIDARTWKTDSSNRDGATQRLILQTGTAGNEYITFAPASGYDGTVALGTPVSFDLVGDLTISGMTKPAVFRVTATVTDDSIMGTATTTIKRSDFNLVIPSIPFVADVDEEFPVTIDIVAERIMQ